MTNSTPTTVTLTLGSYTYQITGHYDSDTVDFDIESVKSEDGSTEYGLPHIHYIQGKYEQDIINACS